MRVLELLSRWARGREGEGEGLPTWQLLGLSVTVVKGLTALGLLGAWLAWIWGLKAVELLGRWVRGPEGERCCRTTPTCPALSLWPGCGPYLRTWTRQEGPTSLTRLMTLK